MAASDERAGEGARGHDAGATPTPSGPRSRTTRTYAPHPAPRTDVHPLHSASVEVSAEKVREAQAEGSLSGNHGDVTAALPEKLTGLRLHQPEKSAAGLKAVVSSFQHAWGKAGFARGTLPLLRLNQKDGFDCMSCAWPDHDGHRSAFEFCENGAKAVAHESDRKRLRASFFAKHSVADLCRQSDYWLEAQGRLTEPMVLRAGATHYAPISWEDAFSLIATELAALGSPDEAMFYTSGRAPNEAAFAYQLFVRQFGTNNLPDCSNMCHESSGTALTRVLGCGKGTVKLDDFGKTQLVFVVGQNPGTNHPRQLSALEEAKRAGATIVAVNPLPEAGLMGFMNPQEPLALLGKSTKLADIFLQVRINGDVPLFKGILKALVEADDRDPGSAIAWDFVRAHTAGIDELLASVRAVSWEAIERGSGIPVPEIRAVAELARKTDRIIVSWALGLTQHHNGPGNVQELMNLLLIRGAMAKPGAGACCVRGHSNVQGDRTMGVWERPRADFLDMLGKAFDFSPPREHGLDTQKAIKAMHDRRGKVFISLGGNFLAASPDTAYTGEALSRTNLTARIGTKLNRSDVVTGRQALILPCLGRTEVDLRPASAGRAASTRIVSCENAMGVVQASRGSFTPASRELLGETAIVCRMAHAVLGKKTTVDWLAWADDYDLIRDGIAKVVPGCEDYNEKVRRPGGFYLPNPPREGVYPTDTGKANFTVNPMPERQLEPGQLVLTTVRSHDQFNTTIYGLDDRYRGVHHERRVIFLNREDMRARHLSPRQLVDATSHFNGQTRVARGIIAIEYPIPRGCAAMYYPEANVLIPIGSTEPLSNIPTFKHTVITLRPAEIRATT
jgi:molybdopterin-dependent oxidoreductase alpha subunit